MPTVNERILKAQIKHSVYLERYKEGMLRKIVKLLNASEEDLISQIAARLSTIDARGHDLGPATTKRLQKLLGEIRSKREQVYSVIGKSMLDEMIDFAKYEADYQIRLSDNVGVAVNLDMPSNAQLKAIVTAQPFQGRILKEWSEGIAQADLRRIQDAVRIGMTEGQTTDQIVRRIRGTKANKFKDGILETSRREAASLVRTAIAHTANRARAEVFNANADIVHKVQYVATLDSRTTILCAARDGKVYDLGKEPVLPAHFSCRSIYIGYFEGDEPGNRASVNGPVPSNTNFSDFLKTQGEDFQNEVLGVERAKLWRSGTPLEKFVDKSGHVYTLDELRRKET